MQKLHCFTISLSSYKFSKGTAVQTGDQVLKNVVFRGSQNFAIFFDGNGPALRSAKDSQKGIFLSRYSAKPVNTGLKILPYANR